jgi:hypothetical protein
VDPKLFQFAEQGLMMEAASTSETSENYHATRLNTPEDSYFHDRRRENLNLT